MPHPDQPVSTLAARRPLLGILLGILLGALALLCIAVLKPFIIPMVWAGILAYTSWPALRLIDRLCRHRPVPAALVMTTLVAVVLIVPLLALAVLLQNEVTAVYQALLAYRSQGTLTLPTALRAIPWLGDLLQKALDRYLGDPLLIRQLIIDWAQNSQGVLLGVGRTLSRNVVKLFIAIVTLFFFYRDGAALELQAARVLSRFFGGRLDAYMRAAGVTTRAVIFGLLITALVQGILAGIGYAVFRVDAPVLLGAATALASIVPVVGTFLIWGSVAVALMLTGHPWPGLGLLVWGTVLVHPVDNLIRPLVISNVTRMPFLLVMFGVLGGLAAFGLIGLFIGPVALAVATAVWREWLEEPHDVQSPPTREPQADAPQEK